MQSLRLILVLIYVGFVEVGLCIVVMMPMRVINDWLGLVSAVRPGRAEPWRRKVVTLALGAIHKLARRKHGGCAEKRLHFL